ncbi:MAG: hypothetical protein ACREJ2_02270 [Planctomycetota bacterium]
MVKKLAGFAGLSAVGIFGWSGLVLGAETAPPGPPPTPPIIIVRGGPVGGPGGGPMLGSNYQLPAPGNCTLQFQIQYSTGKPAANLKCVVLFYDHQPAPEVLGPAPAVGRAQMIDRILASQALTTDAKGLLKLPSLGAGKYFYRVRPGYTLNAHTQAIESLNVLPDQTFDAMVELDSKTAPIGLEVYPGVDATVTVVDDRGQPVSDAMVVNFETSDAWGLGNGFAYLTAGQAFFANGLPNARTNQQGVARLEHIGAYNLNLMACKPGYYSTVQKNVTYKQGGQVAVRLELKPLKPVSVTIRVTDINNQGLASRRCLLVPQDKIKAVCGHSMLSGLSAAQIDAYIAHGAIDLGQTDAQGSAAKHDLPFGLYQAIIFLGDDYGVGTMSVGSEDAGRVVSVCPSRPAGS